MSTETAEDVLRRAYAASLASLDLETRTRTGLAASAHSHGRVLVIAAGKAVAPMVAGAVAHSVERSISMREIVVARPVRAREVAQRERDTLARVGVRIDEFATGHPLPDEASVAATRAICDAIERCRDAHDAVWVLLSGGASAALCAPREGLSLEDVRAITKSLLASGLPIDVVNAARGRVDRIKHGGMSRVARTSALTTLLVSDVLGDEETAIASVGSGPTIDSPRDETRVDRARDVLPERMRAWLDLPQELPVTLGPRDVRLIASPRLLREAFVTALECALDPRIRVVVLPDASDDVDALADRYLRHASTLAPGEAFVAVGEPTVILPAHPGRGGRAGRLALRMAQGLDGANGVAFLAGASDGVDGESHHAGAVITGETVRRARERGCDLAHALARFDDSSVHELLETTLDPGPTGLNVLDVHALVRLAP